MGGVGGVVSCAQRHPCRCMLVAPKTEVFDVQAFVPPEDRAVVGRREAAAGWAPWRLEG